MVDFTRKRSHEAWFDDFLLRCLHFLVIPMKRAIFLGQESSIAHYLFSFIYSMCMYQ